jgi:hypothetical protein
MSAIRWPGWNQMTLIGPRQKQINSNESVLRNPFQGPEFQRAKTNAVISG